MDKKVLAIELTEEECHDAENIFFVFLVQTDEDIIKELGETDVEYAARARVLANKLYSTVFSAVHEAD